MSKHEFLQNHRNSYLHKLNFISKYETPLKDMIVFDFRDGIKNLYIKCEWERNINAGSSFDEGEKVRKVLQMKRNESNQ